MKTGDRVEVIKDGVSFGAGIVEQVYYRGNGDKRHVTGVHVKMDSGAIIVTEPGNVRSG